MKDPTDKLYICDQNDICEAYHCDHKTPHKKEEVGFYGHNPYSKRQLCTKDGFCDMGKLVKCVKQEVFV